MPRTTTPTTTPTTKSAAVKRAASQSAVTKKAAAKRPTSKAAPGAEAPKAEPLKWGGREPPPETQPPEGEYIMSPNGVKLIVTERPGVFLNPVWVEVDYRGIALSLLKAAKVSQEQAEIEVLGHPVKDPLDLLKFGALDRSLPLATRLEAAKGAVPYTNRKMPMAVDGGANPDDPNGPGLPINLNLAGLSNEELKLYRALLEKAQKASGGG